MENSTQHLYSKGLDYLQNGNILKSIDCWNEINKIDAEDVAALQNLAFCHLKLENFTDVIRIINKALFLEPNNPELIKIRAESAYYLSDFSSAIKDLEKFISMDTSDEWVWQILIYSLIFSGDIEKVKRVNKRALLYHSKHIVFNYINIKLLLLEQDNVSAATKVEQLLTDNESEEDVHSLAAETYIKNNNIDLSISHLQKVIELNHERNNELNALGWLYFKKGKYNDAEQMFDKSIQLDGHQFEAYLGSGYCYLKLENFELANKMYKAALSMDQQDIRGWELGFLLAHKMDDRNFASKPVEMIKKLESLGHRTMFSNMLR